MTFYNHCQQAFINVSAAKLRSFLAILGVLVGTAAVVALISCGQLATEAALEEFKNLGTDLLAVSVYQKERHSSSADSQIPLSFWRQIPELVPNVLQVAPYATAYQSISFGGHDIQGSIIAADESLAKIINIDLSQGNFVSFVDTFEHYCVIGNSVATQLKKYSLDNPMGKKIQIGKTLYTIIGVAKPWSENSFFNEDVNQSVIIPIAGLQLVSTTTAISNAIMLLKQNAPIDPVIASLRKVILSKAPKLSVFPRSAKQIIASMESQGRIFTLLLGVIGGISLLVGGIGVMNVMLVSVSERKKEIGIRKAVGAKNSEIHYLFLVESVMLSLFGGLIGVLLGLVFTWIVAYFSAWTFTVHLLPALAGFVVSVATGVFFGFYPARRAAKLEPIISLRSE